ncbi:LysR family transcriptional regulator [Gluconacetobacter sacchari]|uniref:LysR family transcriptional regulator n=1 Tax=Gluconacetobacter sacchari TaxID=92759 RepID=UPI0039B36F65
MVLLSKFSRYFQEIVACGSIRKAADVLNIAASAVDRQVLNAEEKLGIRLFDRTPGGLRLTAAGEAVSHQIARWARDEITLHSHLEELRSGTGGEIRLAVADGPAASFIPTFVERLSAERPGLRFGVVVGSADIVAALVRSGKADIGLTFDPSSFAGLRIESQAASRLGVLVPADHPLTRKKGALHLADCANFPVIAPDGSTALAQMVERLFADVPRPFNVVFTSNNVALLCDMVKRRMGIAFMRDLDAFGHYTEQAVFLPLCDIRMPPQRLSLIVAAQKPLAPGQAAILADIAAALDELGAARGPAETRPGSAPAARRGRGRAAKA